MTLLARQGTCPPERPAACVGSFKQLIKAPAACWFRRTRAPPGRQVVQVPAAVFLFIAALSTAGFCAAGSSATAVCVGTTCSARRAPVEYARRDAAMRGRDPYVRLLAASGSAECAASRAGRDTCLDATGAKSVVDLTCLHFWPHAHFHRLVDCAVQDFELFEVADASQAALLIVPHAMQPFQNLFLSTVNKKVVLKPDKGDSNSTCVCIDADASVSYETRTLGTTAEQSARAMRFRERTWRIVGLPAVVPAGHGTLLFMSRHGARELQNEHEVLLALTRNVPGLSLAKYCGNETLVQTVTLFAGARVVFGFHGAGHGNAVFCRNDTLVVEVTLMKDEKLPSIWRTNNKVSTLHGRLKWRVHALPLGEASVPGWDMQNRSTRATDTELQSKHLVRISPAEMLNVVNMIRGDLGLDAAGRLA